MSHLSLSKLTLRIAIGALVIANPTHAIQPLSEAAMGDVSFDSGIEILSVYGPTSAGLEDDVEITSTEPENNSDKEIETASKTADEVILDSEQTNAASDTLESLDENLSFSQIEAAIAEGRSASGSAQFLETNSEIRYREAEFLRNAEFFDNGGIRQDRDLVIEQLRFENLRGDYQDSERSVGDIYLTNWQSRGSTRLTED